MMSMRSCAVIHKCKGLNKIIETINLTPSLQQMMTCWDYFPILIDLVPVNKMKAIKDDYMNITSWNKISSLAGRVSHTSGCLYHGVINRSSAD